MFYKNKFIRCLKPFFLKGYSTDGAEKFEDK